MKKNGHVEILRYLSMVVFIGALCLQLNGQTENINFGRSTSDDGGIHSHTGFYSFDDKQSTATNFTEVKDGSDGTSGSLTIMNGTFMRIGDDPSRTDKSRNAEITVSGDLELSGTLTYHPGSKLNVEGDLTIANGSSLTVDGELEVDGHVFINDGNAITGNGYFAFRGLAQQEISVASSVSIPGIIIDNEFGIRFLTSEDVSIPNVLDFQRGNLVLGDGNLTVGEILNAGSNQFIALTGNGALVMNVSAARASVVFPVSYNDTQYYPVTIANPDVDSDFAVKLEDGLYDACGTGNEITSDVVTMQWNIVPTVATQADITLTWDETQEAATFDNTFCSVMHCDGGVFTPVGGFTDGSSRSLSATGVATFGWFGIGDGFYATTADVKLFLQGPYAGSGVMNTGLNSLLPLVQPYSASVYDGTHLDYNGTESVTTMPSNVVDWVLVELRSGTAATSKVETKAALLLNDGSIVSHKDASSPVRFEVAAEGDYYLVIHHRNHLSIMSSVTHSLVNGTDQTTQYDFTSAAGNAFGVNAMNNNGDASFSAYSGDGDSNNDVNATDEFNWRQENGMTNIYSRYDFDLNGDVNATDYTNHYQLNTGNLSQVPF